LGACRFTKGVRIWHASSIASTGDDISVAAILAARSCYEIANAAVCSASEGNDRALANILKYLITKLGYANKLAETP
jgi:hypothetical protein